MADAKQPPEACTEEPDWANFPLDGSLLESMPPLSPEARTDHEQGMDFHKRLNKWLENNPETQGAMKWFTPIRSTESVAEANRDLDERVQYLHDHGAHDLAAELPLWWNRGTKRAKGIPPEDPLDDRPMMKKVKELSKGMERQEVEVRKWEDEVEKREDEVEKREDEVERKAIASKE